MTPDAPSEISRQRAGRIPVDPDVLIWALPVACIGAVGWIWGWAWLWIPALILLVLLLGFFRDPPRHGPSIPGALWSPADGKVDAIEENHDPVKGPAPGTRVSIFLSVLDVHINRSPCAGTIERIRYQRGKFLNALDRASGDHNESNWIYMRTGSYRLTVRQAVGLIARRIVCRVREGQHVRRGQRIGLIRMGSRTDLFLPPEAEIRVRVGQRVKGGHSVIAILPEPETTGPDA